jgi:hypothetical protein
MQQPIQPVRKIRWTSSVNHPALVLFGLSTVILLLRFGSGSFRLTPLAQYQQQQQQQHVRNYEPITTTSSINTPNNEVQNSMISSPPTDVQQQKSTIIVPLLPPPPPPQQQQQQPQTTTATTTTTTSTVSQPKQQQQPSQIPPKDQKPIDWQLDTPTLINDSIPLTRTEHQFPKNPKELHEFCDKHFRQGASTGQFSQDRLLNRIFAPLQQHGLVGRFLDTASSWPMFQSNSFVFDVCLRWRGVCVEGDPAKFHLYVRSQMRMCEFEPRCISNKEETLRFASNGERGDAYIVSKDKVKSSVGEIIEIPCESLKTILKRHPRFTHFDFWSLDLEGYETQAVESIDWSETKIDFVLVENNRMSYRKVEEILKNQGYIKIMKGSEIDDLWLHKDSIWMHYCTFSSTANSDFSCKEIPPTELRRRSQFRWKQQQQQKRRRRQRQRQLFTIKI